MHILSSSDAVRMAMSASGTVWVLASDPRTDFIVPLFLVVVTLALVGRLLRARSTRKKRKRIPIPAPLVPPRSQIVGDARKIQWRQDVTGFGQNQRSTAVCTFRIERFDEQGNPLQPVMVEIRSQSGFTGDLSEGDRVSLYEEKRTPNGGFVAPAIRNLSTGGVFGAKSEVDDGLIDVPQGHQSTVHEGN
jgi:hypothetical protein